MARALALLGLLLTLAGCGRGADSTADETPRGKAVPAYGDTLVEAFAGNISGLIPNITSDSYSHEIGGLIYNGLITRDRDLNFVGDLASSWEMSRDCLDLTFHLRPDAVWQDGQPFTADDVVFTYRTMIDPKTPSAYKDDFSRVDSVEALDPATVRVRYKVPFAKSMQTWEMWMLPKHLLEPAVRQGRLREAPENRSAPVGTGPYRLREWKPGEKVVLTANPRYFRGAPYISRVVYRIIPSQATIFLELKAKGIDAAGLTALQYARQTDYPAFRKEYRKYRGRSLLEADRVDDAKRILDGSRRRGVPIVLPLDVVVADGPDSAAGRVVNIREIPADLMALDIGPLTVERFGKAIQSARTVVWNGPMGVFEKAPFAEGTLGVGRAVAGAPVFSVVGGGDTISAIRRAGVFDRISYVSTAGGAFLEFLEGRALPGVDALTDAA